MKKLLTILLASVSLISYGQTDINRQLPVGNNPSNTATYNKQSVVDANLKVRKTLYIPNGATATLNNAKDSTGAVYFAVSDSSFNVRLGGNWVKFKTYDNALASFVPVYGNSTIYGIKTFNSSPIVPTATNSNQAVNLGQVGGIAPELPNGVVTQGVISINDVTYLVTISTPFEVRFDNVVSTTDIAPDNTLQLLAPDGTYNRIDAIYANSDGSYGFVTGTASVAYSPPPIPSNTVQLALIYRFSNGTNAVVYSGEAGYYKTTGGDISGQVYLKNENNLNLDSRIGGTDTGDLLGRVWDGTTGVEKWRIWNRDSDVEGDLYIRYGAAENGGLGYKIARSNDLALKANIASPTFTGTVTIPTPFTLGAVSVLPTGTELNYVDGVTSSIQTQLDSKIGLSSLSATSPIFYSSGTGIISSQAASASLSGYVTTGTQTFSGAKDFSSDVLVNGLTIGRGTGNNQYNTAIGKDALLSSALTSEANVSVGHSSLRSNTTGDENIGIGFEAGYNNTTGHNNVAVGSNSLRGNATTSNNVAIGSYSLNNATGASNIGVGYQAGNGLTTGTKNVVLGFGGYGLTTESNTVTIGEPSTYTGSNKIVVGTNGATLMTATESAGAFGTVFNSTLTGTSFIKSGGTSSQFLKADGSIDANTYLTSGSGVSSITGTANQVISSASTGEITLSLPQSIGTGSSPTFSTVAATTFTGALTGNASTATTAGTVTTAAQPAITSVGTLTSLTSSGTITSGGTVEAQEGFLQTYHANATDGAGYYIQSLTNTTGSTKNSIGNFGIIQAGDSQRSGAFNVNLYNAGTLSNALNIAKTGYATFAASVTAPSLTVSTTPTTSAGTYDILTRNTSTGVIEKIASSIAGTVSSVSVITANGVSGSVATATTTPAITLTLGAITPTSTNGVSSTVMAYNDATSSIQTQINGKAPSSGSANYINDTTTPQTANIAITGDVVSQASVGSYPASNIANGAMTQFSTATERSQFLGTEIRFINNSFTQYIKPFTTLTANRIITFPDAEGTVAIVLSGSATLDFPNTLAQTDSDLTITVTGAVDGDPVDVGIPNASANAGSCYTAWVSAADTVTVRFSVYGVLAKDPASGTFKVKVFK